MNLIDVFAFLFTTNAKQAQKDVEAFGKSTQNVQDTLNRADKTASNLGLSFSKLALAGVAALESFASLGKLKEGINNAINYNAEIEKTSRLTGVNARQLTLWNDVVAKAGGNPGGREYLSFITKLNQQYANLGLNDRVKRVNQDLINLSSRFAELEARAPGSSQALASKLGIGPDLWLALKDGPAILQQNIDAFKKLDNVTGETSKDAFMLKQSWVELGVQFNSLATSFQPIARVLTDIVSTMLKGWQILSGVISGVIGTVTGGKIGGWQDIDKQLAEQFPDWFGKDYNKRYGTTPEGDTAPAAAPPVDANSPLGIRNNNPGNLRAAPGATTVGGFARFGTLGQGLAAEQRQLSIYGRRGWNTLSQIAAHWAPSNENDTRSYIARLAKQTGFGPNDQLNLNDPAILAKVANAINVNENGSGYGGLIAGQSALAAANSAPLPGSLGGGGKTVTIGSITINTQATDAKGIALDLKTELASTVASFDDGVKH